MCTECLKVVINMLNGKNSKQGFHVHGKLTFKHVKGGVKLIETNFTLKEERIIKSIDKF